MSMHLGSQAKPEVVAFLQEWGITSLQRRLAWVTNVAQLMEIEPDDLCLEDVSKATKDKFFQAVKSRKAKEKLHKKNESEDSNRERTYTNQATIDAHARRATNGGTIGMAGHRPYANQRSIDAQVQGKSAACPVSDTDYENDAAALVECVKSTMKKGDMHLDAMKSLMMDDGSDGEDDQVYENEEVISLHKHHEEHRKKTGTITSMDPESAAAMASTNGYENQEAIELQDIDAHHSWMHGPITRGEAESRLRRNGKAGAFLVRMKGASGRVFAFSILTDATKNPAGVRHNLIAFEQNDKILIDGRALQRSCKSLRRAIRILCALHTKSLPPGSKTQGILDDLLLTLRSSKHVWRREECTRAQAETLLAKELPGAFILRNASQGNELCISIRLNGNKMFNGLISKQPMGYKIGKSLISVAELEDIVRAIMVDPQILKSLDPQLESVKLRLPDGF
eukprot:m.237246 g.237246  ORF g.237246 m.237246 type:complete len:453 (-) comp19367_c0_seq1:525-1883(-)